MSFLNLRKLVSPRLKIWKSLRNKLQTKIGKLNRSKAIIIHKASKKKSCKRLKKLRWPFEKKKLKPKHHALIHLNRITPPLYHVDPLFVQESMSSPVAAIAKESNYYNNYREKTRKEATRSDDDDDDDNESEINEMAEEFITRFRAQMHHHEMLARHF